MSTKDHEITCQRTSPLDNKHIDILFTDEPIKNRYDEKKRLYEVYRESLQKKKGQNNYTNK